MKNGKKILKIELLVCIILLLSSTLSGQSNTNTEKDTLRQHLIRQVNPYLKGVSWIKELIKIDTSKSPRTVRLAPLAKIDANWLQTADCGRKVTDEWVHDWGSLGSGPSYDIFPYYFFHNSQICHVFGFMSKDSIGIIWGLMNFDTTVIILNRLGFKSRPNDYLLDVFTLSKQYHVEPYVQTLYLRTKTGKQTILDDVKGEYFDHTSNSNSNRKPKLTAIINDSMVYALNRWWRIQFKNEIDVHVQKVYRIFAIDLKTNRPGYFLLRDGIGGRKWSLSLTIERSPIVGRREYFELGEKELKDPMQRFRQFIRVLKFGAYFTVVTAVIIFYFLYFTQKKRRQQQQTQLSLAGLRAQLNPHFLFNTLTSIQDLMNQDNKPAANRYFNEMAQLLRYVVDSSVEETTNLASEVAALEKYCSLEALRTSFDYHFDIRSEIDLQNTEIPTMLLQPFVENAILHGLRPSSIPKDLQISMWPEGEDRIGISIIDNGIGIDASEASHQDSPLKRSHRGINTTRKRIELLNIGKKQKITLTIADRSQLKANQKGTLVQLSIPI